MSPIDLDHTHILGDSLKKITSEKAGIIKPGTLTIITPRIKVDAVRDLGGRVLLLGDNFDAAKAEAQRIAQTVFSWDRSWGLPSPRLPLSVPFLSP